MATSCMAHPDFGTLVATVGISTFFFLVIKVLRERSNSNEDIPAPKYAVFFWGGICLMLAFIALSDLGCSLFS